MRSITIEETKYHGFTVGDIEALLNDARNSGATEYTDVNIEVAPKYNNPVDPGGEITISILIGLP